MTTVTATAVNAALATPGTQSQPNPGLHHSPQIPTSQHHRREVACVFVVEGTARMQPHMNSLIDAYVEPILKQLRSPYFTDDEDRQTKTKVTPILRYGMVVFGDYDPASVVTVDRKYFTSDLGLFQQVFRAIRCADGGILRNAAGEGLVAALELFDQYREETEKMGGNDPIMHCILISNSLPHQNGASCNQAEKYNNFKLDDIIQEMRKHDIRLSLITPSKGYADFERLVEKVNEGKIELHTPSETISSSHVVKLAGFKLPESKPVSAPDTISKQETSKASWNGHTASKRLSESSVNVTSPQALSPVESNKRRKRDNVPGQIDLPKATVDPAKFAQVEQKHYATANNSVPTAVTTTQADTTSHQPGSSKPQPLATQTPTPPKMPTPEQRMQQLQPPMQGSMQRPPMPTSMPQVSQQQMPQRPQQPQQPQQQQTPAQQPGQQPAPGQQQPGQRFTPNTAQFQQILAQRRYLMSLPQLSPQQRHQLQLINTMIGQFLETKRSETAQQGDSNANANIAAAMAATGISSPMNFNNMAARPTGMPDMSKATSTPQQNPAQLAQRGINPSNPALANSLQQQQQQQQQQRLLLAAQMNAQQLGQQTQASPQLQMNMGNTMDQQSNMNQNARLANQPAGLGQQQQQQQQQQPYPAQGQPLLQQPPASQLIWRGQIVWHIKVDDRFQEFSCHCGAFTITMRGRQISLEEYRPDVWPQRIQITKRLPFQLAQQTLQKEIMEKGTLCQFRILDTSNQQDHSNFNALLKNLEQKKYVATALFNPALGDQSSGVVLTFSGGKLIGLVFAKTPVPEFEQQQQTPQGLGHNMQDMSNLANVMMGASNASQQLLQSLRQAQAQQQQQQQQQTQQPSSQTPQAIMNNAALGGSPMAQMAGGRPGLNPNSLLLSNINISSPNVAGMNMGGADNGMAGMGNMAAMGAGFPGHLTPQALRELQRMMVAKRQQQQQQNQQHM